MTVKNVIYFLVGAAAGSLGTYFMMKKSYEEKVRADLEENRKHYQKKIEEYSAVLEKKEYDDVVTTLGYKEAPEEKEEEGNYVAYNRMSREEVKNRVKKIQEQAIVNDNPKEDYPDEPIVITEEEYAENELYFEKMEAELYTGDGALVDENEELMNVEDTIGYGNFEKLMNSNEAVMYVRNAKLATDYLVTKVGGEYSEIMGFGGDNDD